MAAAAAEGITSAQEIGLLELGSRQGAKLDAQGSAQRLLEQLTRSGQGAELLAVLRAISGTESGKLERQMAQSELDTGTGTLSNFERAFIAAKNASRLPVGVKTIEEFRTLYYDTHGNVGADDIGGGTSGDARVNQRALQVSITNFNQSVNQQYNGQQKVGRSQTIRFGQRSLDIKAPDS